MHTVSPKWKLIITRPIFMTVWFLLVAILIAIGLAFFLMPLGPALVEAGILLAVIFFAFLSIYRAATLDWINTLEHNELATILASLDDGVIVYDSSFKIIFFNASSEHMFKLAAVTALGHVLSPRDVENDGWRTLIQVIFPSLAPQVINHSPEGQNPVVADISFRDPQLELRVITAPIVDEKNNTIAFIKIIRDRTPQILALREKDEFVTVASHQLRGPVTDISWALQSLASVDGLSESDKMIVMNAAAASQGLLRRIEDLLNVSRMEDGRLGYQFQDMDINDFLAKELADLLPAARKAGIKLYFDRPTTDMPHVMIDPKMLSIVIVNLIENAIRYNIENGEVIVRVEKNTDKPFIEVSVRDTGIGIPSEAVSKLFTKFFRAENAVKSQTEGSGIGLYIARGIVRAHGGEIWAESELNRGTTIHFTIPTDPTLVPKREVSGEAF